ncbi:MAG TPA: IS30 family transposase [Candidatus Limnocylindrales bacterium]|jgi:IS30 family transposase
MGRRRGDRALTSAERLEIRRRVATGEPIGRVAAGVGRSSRLVHLVLRRAGGLPPRISPRSTLRLSEAEREEISRGLRAGESCRRIAARLARAPSTVSREVGLNGGRQRYRAWRAEAGAAHRGRRPRLAKLARNARLRHTIERLLEAHWSPQQIAQRLRHDHPDDQEMRVSHETIYQSLFVQGRGALRTELSRCLRSGRVRRRPRGRIPQGGRLTDMVFISERPAEIEDRAVPGHWEGDLLIGTANRSAIGTLVERQTRYVLLVALPGGRSAEHVRTALASRIMTLPEELRRSLTWDRGKEMAEHVRFTVDTGVQVYFCDPRSPWQRGSNENTNGLLRQYFPKGTDLSVHDQAHLDAVARELNGRPRQTLGWLKPSEALAKVVASTG